jgi:uncharacterized membrane protein YdjX (TVP38/TMEM64 family)
MDATQIDSPDNKQSSQGLWKPIAIIITVVFMLFLAWYLGIGEWLKGLQSFIDGLGFWGPIVFVVMYIVATVAAIPGSAFSFIGGAIFGSVLGTIVVSLGSTIGAALCFLISRYFARDAMSEWLSKNEKFQKLDQMTEKSGAMIVALTRLVPLFPFNLLNYGFGLTKVNFWTYVFWSWLCMIPGTISYVVGADAATRGVTEGRVPWHLLGVLIIVVLALSYVVKYARQKLHSEENKTI